MPLFIDIHVVEDKAFSEIAAMQGHHKDIAVQHRFGVKHIKYFLNLPEKRVFCLMEAPNKKACIENHMAAHGIGACNVIEVSSEIDFRTFLGEGAKNENDLALTLSGEIDTGYRTLMMICVADFSGKYGHCIDEMYRLIQKYQGSKIMQPNDKIMASFVLASDAFLCCLAASRLLKTEPRNIDYTIALVTGKPVDEAGSDFFGETKKQLLILSRMGKSGVIHMDKGTAVLSQKGFDTPDMDNKNVKFVSKNEFSFLENLYKILDVQISDSSFNNERLGKEIRFSKAQAYRKIKSLTGMSPNTLIREMRLRRSLSALKKNSKTVAEIAYDLGFNSPTYFTRVFRKRYEMLPTEFAKRNKA